MRVSVGFGAAAAADWDADAECYHEALFLFGLERFWVDGLAGGFAGG
jgi:hypothetical protein